MTVLLLAGSGEGRRMCGFCADHGIPTLASLAGATRDPKELAVPVRVGGFGGGAEFVSFVKDQGITRILDMTHPFAAAISQRTAQIAAQNGWRYLRYERPTWRAGAQDHWISIAKEEDAAQHVAEQDTVFLATGRQTLDRFAPISHARLICRQIDPPSGPFPFPNGHFQVGRPPFSIEQEVDLFTQLGVTVLVTKNAGGTASRSKLDAARQMNLPVLMLQRPQGVPGPVTDDLERVKRWLLDGS